MSNLEILYRSYSLLPF